MTKSSVANEATAAAASRHLTLAAVFLALGLLLVAAALWGWNASHLTEWYWAVGAWMLVSLVLLLPLSRLLLRSSDIFAPPMFVLGFAAFDFFARGAVLLVWPETFKYPDLLSGAPFWSALTTSFLYGAAAYLVFLIGYNLASKRKKVIRLPSPSQAYLRALTIPALLLLPLGYLIYFWFTSNIGGVTGLLLSLHERIELLEGRHYEFSLIRWVYISPLLLFVVHVIRTGGQNAVWKNKAVRALLLGLLILGCLLMATFGARGRALTPLVVMIVLWHYLIRPVRLTKIFLLIPVFIIAANLILAARTSARYSLDLSELLTGMSQRVSFTSAGDQLKYFLGERIPFAHVDAFAVMVARMPDDLPFQFSLPLNALSLPVPRRIWPSKPTGSSGTIFSATWLPDNPSAQPPGDVGTAFMMFHLAGVIVFFFFNGVLMRWLYSTFLANRHRPVIVLSYVFLLVLAPGLLIPTYKNIYIHVVPLYLIGIGAHILTGAAKRARQLVAAPGRGLAPKLPT